MKIIYYSYIKDFSRFMCNKTKNKNKKYFCKGCLQCFSSEKILIEHKENCLVINGKQSVKLKNGLISFKNYLKQLPVHFKIYADFKYLLKGVKSNDKNNGSYTKSIKNTVLAVLLIKLFVLIINLARQLFFTEEKMLLTDLLKQFLKSIIIVKIIKNHFNKNLIMSAEEGERFQLSNSCWICDKLFEAGDDKIRDHCHITGKYRGATHWSCNLKLPKKITVIFHNLRGYDSHLIITEISKFVVKLSVIPNGLEKYMTFTINTNLVFIDSM